MNRVNPYYICVECRVVIPTAVYRTEKSPCRRGDHMVMFVPGMDPNESLRKLPVDDRTLMRRAREKWHEWKKDKYRNIGIGF